MSSSMAGTTPLLGTAGGVGHREPLVSWKMLRQTCIGIAFIISTLLLLPYTLYLTLEHVFATTTIIMIYLVGVATILVILARNFANDNKIRKEQRQWRRTAEAVIDGTYQCVTPQVLNSMVVFPIKVLSRDAAEDRVANLDDKAVSVELAQGGSIGEPIVGIGKEFEEGMRRREAAMKRRAEDTASRLTALISKAISSPRAEFGVKVFSGSGGGPTGLAAGVSCPDYGPTLAAYVGMSLERAAYEGRAESRSMISPHPSSLANGGGSHLASKTQ